MPPHSTPVHLFIVLIDLERLVIMLGVEPSLLVYAFLCKNQSCLALSSWLAVKMILNSSLLNVISPNANVGISFQNKSISQSLLELK